MRNFFLSFFKTKQKLYTKNHSLEAVDVSDNKKRRLIYLSVQTNRFRSLKRRILALYLIVGFFIPADC